MRLLKNALQKVAWIGVELRKYGKLRWLFRKFDQIIQYTLVLSPQEQGGKTLSLGTLKSHRSRSSSSRFHPSHTSIVMKIRISPWLWLVIQGRFAVVRYYLTQFYLYSKKTTAQVRILLTNFHNSNYCFEAYWKCWSPRGKGGFVTS